MADEFDQYKSSSNEFDQYKAAPPPSAASRFGKGALEGAKNVVKGQIQGYEHGGFLNAPETGSAEDLARGVTQTFNPFHPIQTAGYLVPQPVKDVYNAVRGHGDVATPAGRLAAEAAPYATAPLGEAPIRGAARTINAGLDAAPAIGTAVGTLGGVYEVGQGNLEHGLASAYFGGRVGNMISRLPRVPGESYGLGEPTTAYQANTGVFNPTQIRATPFSSAQIVKNPGLGNILTKADRPNGPIHGESGLGKMPNPGPFNQPMPQPETPIGPQRAATIPTPKPNVGTYQPPTRVTREVPNFPAPVQEAGPGPQRASVIPTPKPSVGKYQAPVRVQQPASSVPGPRLTETVPAQGGFGEAQDDAAMMQSIESREGSDLAPAPEVNWRSPWGFESQLAQSTERMQPTSDLGQQAFQEALKQNIERNRIEIGKKGLK